MVVLRVKVPERSLAAATPKYAPSTANMPTGEIGLVARLPAMVALASGASL